MRICNALILTPYTEVIFILPLEKHIYGPNLKKKKRHQKKAVKLLIFMNVLCVAMSLGNEHYNKT